MRSLTLNFLLGVFIVALKDLRESSLPKPRRFVALWLVFLVLSFMAGRTAEWARFSGTLSGLIVLTLAVSNSDTILGLLGVRRFGAGAVSGGTTPISEARPPGAPTGPQRMSTPTNQRQRTVARFEPGA